MINPGGTREQWQKRVNSALCCGSLPALEGKFNVVFPVNCKNAVSPQINTLLRFLQCNRITGAQIFWFSTVCGIAQKIRVSQITDNLLFNRSHSVPPFMAFNFRGFPAPHAFIIAYLIYFVKYETQNIFNFLCFLEPAFIACRSCNPFNYNELVL